MAGLIGRWETLSVAKLVKADWNYKLDSDALQEKLRDNIARMGVVVNLIVRDLGNGSYEVINGNHRLAAIKELNIEEVMCYNVGNVTTQQAVRLAIETNETRFDADRLKLAEIISELMDELGDDDLVGLPYDDALLNEFKGLSDFSFDDYRRPDSMDRISIFALAQKLGLGKLPASRLEVIESKLLSIMAEYDEWVNPLIILAKRWISNV